MTTGKKFVAVRVDISSIRFRCSRDLNFLGLDGQLITELIVRNVFNDRKIIFNYLARISGQLYDLNAAYVHDQVNDMCDEVFFRLTAIFPFFSFANGTEMIPTTDGQCDAIVYVEINAVTSPYFSANLQTKTMDEGAVRAVAGQYRF